MLNSEAVSQVNPDLTTNYIKDIGYNEKGQRNKIIYGNDVLTKFYYDKETFRLIRLETKRKNNDPLQDWHYTFDPVGNITHIVDNDVPVVFFDNQKVMGLSVYTYDAIYRLAEATGRENNAALNFDNHDNWNDAPFIQAMNPGDPMAVRNYTQSYVYDEVGNIRQMHHVATGNTWTRGYRYENTTNRLMTTQVGAETYTYTHHPQHGFILVMPQLQEMGWNFKEELVKSSQQKVNPGNGTAETTYYQYDGQGQRIRKITENSASEGATPTIKNERLYIGGYETFRTYQANTLNFERETLSLMDAGRRFVMVETVKQNTDSAPPLTEKAGARLSRYQLHNHIGSASLEIDETALVISYEEYHPFGTTSYQAKNAIIKAAAKRYRYTGMERDEETGLEYHSARYYMPWLGRWLSADPIGIDGGINFYTYSHNNSIKFNDPGGKDTPADADVRTSMHGKVYTRVETIVREGLYSRLVTTTDYSKFSGGFPLTTKRLYRRDDNLNPDWIDVTKQASREGDLSVEWNMPSLKNDFQKFKEVKGPGWFGAVFPFVSQIYAKDQSVGISNPLLKSQVQTGQRATKAAGNIAGFGRMYSAAAVGVGMLLPVAAQGMVSGGNAIFGLATRAPAATTTLGTATSIEGARGGQDVQTVINIVEEEAPIVAEEGETIALGVREHLDEFAKLVNGSTWKTWGTGNFKYQFIDKINDATTKIYFNLTGPNGKMIDVWNAISEGSYKTFGNFEITKWELYQLYLNKDALARTIFYFNGGEIPNPFVK